MICIVQISLFKSIILHYNVISDTLTALNLITTHWNSTADSQRNLFGSEDDDIC